MFLLATDRQKAKRLNQSINVIGKISDPVDFVRRFIKANGLNEIYSYGKQLTSKNYDGFFEAELVADIIKNQPKPKKMSTEEKEEKDGPDPFVLILIFVFLGMFLLITTA